MSECVALRPKACSCLINDGDGNKKEKGIKKFVIK